MDSIGYSYESKPLARLSLGCMRFPSRDTTKDIVHACVEKGVLYLDTAPGYCYKSDEENCETWIGGAIDGIHEKVILSAKCANGSGNTFGEYNPSKGFGVRSSDQVRAQIEQSLKRLNVSNFDFYQLWGINNRETLDDALKPGGWLEGVRKAQDEGIIMHIGITGHVGPDEMKHWVDTGEFEMITVPFHMLDISRLPGIIYSHEKGIPIIAMNPLAGGVLAGPSDILAENLSEYDIESASELARRFVTAYDSVSALSGMASVSEVEENVRALEKPRFMIEQAEAIKQKFDLLAGRSDHLCTICGYCLPCPERINIPRMLHLRTVKNIIGEERAKSLYKYYSEEWNNPQGVENCTECGECESRCPNELPIISLLKEIEAEYVKPDSAPHFIKKTPGDPGVDCQNDHLITVYGRSSICMAGNDRPCRRGRPRRFPG